MSAYTEDYLATLDPEVAALAREQDRDDTSAIDQQRLGGERVTSIESNDVFDLDAIAVVEDNTQTIFEDAASDEPTLEELKVQAVVALLPEHLQETYYLVYFERLTLREAGARLGIAHTSVKARLRTVEKAVERALA